MECPSFEVFKTLLDTALTTKSDSTGDHALCSCYPK